MARLKVASKVKTPNFSINEVKHAVSELKTGTCSDPTGLIRVVFKNKVMRCCTLSVIWQISLRSPNPYY